MKKIVALLLLCGILFTGSFPATSAGLWTKYVAADQGFSFHYPTGWKVAVHDANSVIEISNQPASEEMIMSGVPFDPRKSPKELAQGFIAMLQQPDSKVQAANWQVDQNTKDTQVLFDLLQNDKGKSFNGLGVLIKSERQATWFSYLAPAAGYSRSRGSALLQGFMGSLTSGAGSPAPSINYAMSSAAKIEQNAQAFLFVLEFALGAPFTSSQEKVILDELKSGWRSLTDAELQKYDQYPALVQTILKMGQHDLEKLRSELEKTTREWVNQSNPSDKAVTIIRDQLQAKGKVVIQGDPPLTEMSLAAYSEITAYARLLRRNPKATPDQVATAAVTEARKQVLQVWKSFSKADQQSIATAPGLWICMRVLLREGTTTEKDKIRGLLNKLSAETTTSSTGSSVNTSTGSGTSSGNQQIMNNMLKHNTLMSIQQMTFNQYMWSRGFNYSPVYGKMW